MAETYNIPRDSTLKELVALHKASLIGDGNSGAIDSYYNSLVLAATSVDEVNALFQEWWAVNWVEDETTYNELLERWFGSVLDDNRVHGVKMPLFATSTSAIGELTDDSEGLSCTPSTASTAGQDDFAYLPQFWCVEVSAEKEEDGTHTIYACELIDDIDTVRNGEHLCWVLQKNTYTREWQDDEYHYFKMRCHAASGYEQWPQGSDRAGNTYAYIANPKYYAGEDSDGVITCGTGLAPVNYTSHTSAVSKWRSRGSQYSGASGNLLKWQLAMIWLKYARKGNSGTIEGCSSYNYQYTAAISEEGVERIILTAAQGANLLEGSNIILGYNGASSTDRGSSYMYSICKNKRISSIESVTIDDVTYAAVYIDNDGETFDTEAGVTYISTMPYWSGWNDDVLGYDGSQISPTTGKEPGLIQKTEFQNGAYIIISDELWQWGTNDDGDYTFDCYTCHDQSLVASAISSNYTQQEDLTLVFAAGTSSGWQYIEDIAVAEDRAVLWPKAVSTSAGSGTGCKAGFSVTPASSGVRAAWCVNFLTHGGYCGLPARLSHYSVSPSYWYGAPGAPGLAG